MDLVEALEAAETDKTPQCLICNLEYLESVNKALRIAKTGRWDVMKVFRIMQKENGFKGSYSTLRIHAREHLGPSA